MIDNKPDNQDPKERVCNRLKLPRTLLVELANGQILGGKSLDISPRGVLMKTEKSPKGELTGTSGTLFVISAGGEFSTGYPCKVVRQTTGSLALEIHKKAAAAFGDYLTRDLLGHQQEK